MKGRTTGKQTAENIRITEKLSLNFKNLLSLCTEHAPPVC